jgi:hypothetical protein
MASRKEEKERLRQEREQAEQAARASESRRKRLGIVLGGLLAVAVVAIVAFALLSGGDDSDKPRGPVTNGDLPRTETEDLKEAVKAAGCVDKTWPDEGNQHLPNQKATFDDYKTNPPTSGTHRPPPAAFDGVYEPGNTPAKENWVHTLEHGRVIFQYKPGTPANRIKQLETLMNEGVNGQPGGFKTVLMENNTGMKAAVAALAWRRSVTCDDFNDKVFDAFRAFRSDALKNPLSPEADFPWPFNGT